jgi:hypothetical protein
MILEITGLERGTIRSKAGKELTGLTINGIKIDREGEAGDEYEKFLMDWKNSDEIATLEEAGIGSTVEMKSVKDGNFWNLDEVIIMEPGTGEPASAGPSNAAVKKDQAKTKGTTKAAVKTETAAVAPDVVMVSTTDESVRMAALQSAVAYIEAILSSDERFKKLLAASKTTAEIVSQMTLETASKFESYIKKGGGDTEVKSDDADLDKDGVDANEPPLPGDEE